MRSYRSVSSVWPCKAFAHTRPTESVSFHWVAQPLWASEHALDSAIAFEGP